MSTGQISDDALGSFTGWVISQTNRDLLFFDDQGPTCLADFIRGWVRSGVAIRACVGDFQTYLIGVIAIIDAWQHDENSEDPEMLDYVGMDLDGEADPKGPSFQRRVTRIFREHEPVEGDILDPHFFAAWRFHHLHPLQER